MKLITLKEIFRGCSKVNRRMTASTIRASEDIELLFIFVKSNYIIEIYDNGYIIANDYNTSINYTNGSTDYRHTVYHINQIEYVDADSKMNFTDSFNNMDYLDAIDFFTLTRFQHNNDSYSIIAEVPLEEMDLLASDLCNPEYELIERKEEQELFRIAHSVLYDNIANLTTQQLDDFRYLFFCDLSKSEIAKLTCRSYSTVRDSYDLAMNKSIKLF